MNTAPRIQSVATALPPHRWPQARILAHLQKHFPVYRRPQIEQVFLNAGIENRHLVLAPGEFNPSGDADELHAIFREHSIKLGREAACGALRRAQLGAGDVDLLVAATCTGYMCPGLSAQLAQELGMPDDLQRADLVGMGCAGALPALQRAHDFVRAYPDKRALVVTVEISSACWYVDETMETVIGNTICADGAAAAVVGTGEAPKAPAIERFATVLDPTYLESVGFEFKGGKNRIVLHQHLRHDAGPVVRRSVERLLDETGLAADEIDQWIVHSGGRRVLDGIEASLELANGELRHSWDVLRECGNMSSPTVLFVLERAWKDAEAGSLGVMIALGPGLAAETALLRW